MTPARATEAKGATAAAERPRVSVFLPCRDAGAHLPDCIASLEAQTVERLEVLAVDDGSEDETGALLDAWARRDGRVRVFRTGGDGPAAACNRAAREARAPVMARMDADDVALPGRLEAQLDLLDGRPGLAACGTGVAFFPDDEVGPGWQRYERWLNGLVEPAEVRRDLLVECPLASPALAVRRSVFRALDGYRDPGWPEDYDFVLRLHRAGMRAANVPRPLLRWRRHRDNLSRNHPAYAPDAFLRCKVHFLLHGFLPEARPPVVWGAGEAGKPLARALADDGRRPRAFVDLDPRKVGQEIHGIPVVDPEGFDERFPDPGGPDDAYVLGAVGAPGAREEIREALERTGRVELRDFRMLA